jgi:fructokinase
MVVGLGELLGTTSRQENNLAGAPANFAYMAAVLGDRTVVASRVGDDPLGSAVALARE